MSRQAVAVESHRTRLKAAAAADPGSSDSDSDSESEEEIRNDEMAELLDYISDEESDTE